MLRTVFFAFALFLVAVSSTTAQEAVPRGSPLRATLMDALRPTFEAESNGPVEFVVDRLTVWRDWAFAEVRPQRPGGQRIDWRRTRYREAVESDTFSNVSFALLRRQGGSWILQEFVIGPTDVAWIEWQQRFRLPEALFSE
jgi:hypothetical protein